jgi:hypothetical protein
MFSKSGRAISVAVKDTFFWCRTSSVLYAKENEVFNSMMDNTSWNGLSITVMVIREAGGILSWAVADWRMKMETIQSRTGGKPIFID